MANEKRLIDANKVPYHQSGFPKGDGFDSGLDWAFREDIDKIPTVDAVEVVRCKDCHWWRKINAKNGCGICRHEVFSVDDCTVDPVTEPDDFCSYGEKREET